MRKLTPQSTDAPSRVPGEMYIMIPVLHDQPWDAHDGILWYRFSIATWLDHCIEVTGERVIDALWAVIGRDRHGVK